MSVPLSERIERYLARCEPAVSGQGGHKTTFKVACILVRGFDLSVDQAYPFLVRYNQRCEPRWSEKELRHKLTSADRTRGSKPRGYLLRPANPQENLQTLMNSTRSVSKRCAPQKPVPVRARAPLLH